MHDHEEESPMYKANTLAVAALTLMKDGKFSKAVPCLDEALSYTADLWDIKGKALLSLKDYPEALKCFDAALSVNPEHAKAKMSKGVALHYLGKYKRAITIYNGLIKEGKSVALAWFNKACAHCMMENNDDTYKCLRTAFNLDPFNTRMHLRTEESFDRLRNTAEFEKLTEEIMAGQEGPAKHTSHYIG